MKRTTIWISQENKKSIETIKLKYGLSTDSDAVRLAITILADSDVVIHIKEKKNAK